MKFETTYDKNKLMTVKDAEVATGKAPLFIKTALKEASIDSLGTVTSGKAGKPPQVYDRTALLAAIEALDGKRAVAAEARKAKAATQTNTETTEQTNEFDALGQKTA